MVSFLSRTFNNFDCQLWKIESVHPSVPNGTYTIKKLNDGTYTIKNTEDKALTVENGSDDNGANICQWEY
ncbi:MAG: RICIN domain-containing protein [Ruminococcus flavefaciens]|nr:RICIN domain-containing protein [Ruminococcus flavefaciens]